MKKKFQYDSVQAIKAYLEEHKLGMQKKFGQNFLINKSARQKIAQALEITNGMDVWEIGAGLGCLTDELLQMGGKVSVFEIDRGFIVALHDLFDFEIAKENLNIVEGDVLKTFIPFFNEAVKKNQVPHRICGNLPYNIAATLIARTIESGIRFEKAVFTVQKELAERITAPVGSKNYSSFSVLCQWAYSSQMVMDLKGGSFWPKPNVDSRVIILTKNTTYPACKNPQFFLKLQRALFASRRKTIKNNLDSFCNNKDVTEKILLSAGIEQRERSENLSIAQLLKVSDIALECMQEYK